MNSLFYWFASPEWARMVATLLHSLWQGAVLAVGLWVGLRFVARPNVRYWLALLALAGTVAASLVTWAVLQAGPVTKPVGATAGRQVAMVATASATAAAPTASVSAAGAAGGVTGGGVTANDDWRPVAPDTDGATGRSAGWSAWLAVVWLLGAAGMLVRAGSQVAGAGRVRQACRPLTEGPVPAMLEHIQKSLGIARRIRMLVTDRLTSPAVAGVLVPVLILPGSLLTSLTQEQLRFILLHELAHIRRGDYLVNLFQLLVEALWFFNPAVWWLSGQIRLEREACCDAMAIELSGAPADYAHTLLHVAERYAGSGPAAVLAFGDEREPSGLAERIHRLLSPGHRPRLRLTWRAMLVSLLVGGGLLVASALGTRYTVAAILTPQQRMDRIETVLKEHVGDVSPMDGGYNDIEVSFSGRVRTEDGIPLPKHPWMHSYVKLSSGSVISQILVSKNGTFKGQSDQGQLTLGLEIPGYAPGVLGPITLQGTNVVKGLELVLRHGFAVTVQLVDADSGAPLANAPVVARFSQPNGNFAERQLITDARGMAVMTHCANLPMDLTGTAAGYEIAQQTFTMLDPGQTLRLTTRRGVATTGRVLDKLTGRPLAGATIQVLRQQGGNEYSYDWDYQSFVLATSDADGRFVTTQLRSDSRYRLGIHLPEHESVEIRGVQAGDSNLVARLGPELVVHGRITGNVALTMDSNQRTWINYTYTDADNNGWGNSIEGQATNGVIYFAFTNREAGLVELSVVGHEERRTVDAPVADWLVTLTNPPADARPVKMRDVVVRLKSSDGVTPRGALKLLVPSNPYNFHYGGYYTNVSLVNGEARVTVPVGAQIQYAADKNTLGYWFASGFNSLTVVAGEGPQVVEVPVIPAGIIVARAKNVDGSPAGGLMFAVQLIKKSPAVKDDFVFNDGGDSMSGNAPRTYISEPLPLGGTYEIIGWRDNSFCSSGPITLTGAVPAPAVEMSIPAGQDITGRVLLPDGQPARNASVGNEGDVDEHSFGLKSVFTDADGNFRLTDCSPTVANYSLNISEPGCAAVMVKVNFKRLPLTAKLEPGLKLSGQVIEAATGKLLADAEVRVYPVDGSHPMVTARTDANGNYQFDTLAKTKYYINVSGGNLGDNYDNTFEVGGVTNLVLKVTPYPGGELTEKSGER